MAQVLQTEELFATWSQPASVSKHNIFVVHWSWHILYRSLLGLALQCSENAGAFHPFVSWEIRLMFQTPSPVAVLGNLVIHPHPYIHYCPAFLCREETNPWQWQATDEDFSPWSSQVPWTGISFGLMEKWSEKPELNGSRAVSKSQSGQKQSQTPSTFSEQLWQWCLVVSKLVFISFLHLYG